MFLPSLVCLSVRLSVKSSVNSNGRIRTKFSGQVQNGPRTNRLVFGGDPDHLDQVEMAAVLTVMGGFAPNFQDRSEMGQGPINQFLEMIRIIWIKWKWLLPWVSVCALGVPFQLLVLSLSLPFSLSLSPSLSLPSSRPLSFFAIPLLQSMIMMSHYVSSAN